MQNPSNASQLCLNVNNYKECIKAQQNKLNDIKQQKMRASLLLRSNAERFGSGIAQLESLPYSQQSIGALVRSQDRSQTQDLKALRNKWQKLVQETTQNESTIRNITDLISSGNRNP